MQLLSLPSIPYILASVLLPLISILYLQKKLNRAKSNLPPGPSTLPVIGCLHHLAKASLPHHALHNLAQSYGPVMLLRAGQVDLLVITSREAAKEVLKTQDANFGHRPVLYAANVLMYDSTDISFSNGPHWQRMRQICTMELFSPSRVRSFFSIRQEEINSMMKTIASIPENSSVNLSAKTSELSTNVIIAIAFGRKCKSKDIFLENLCETVELLSGFNLSDLFPSLRWLDVYSKRKLTRVQSKLDLVLEEIVQEHMKQPKKGEDEDLKYDSVDVLIDVMKNGSLEKPITIDNIKAVILDIFAGGTEGLSTTITWAMAELIRNPEVMAKVQKEIREVQNESGMVADNTLRYLKLVIKETMRLHPVAPLVPPRLCKESCTVLGYSIPSETKVLINAWSLGRNPDYWNDPEEFKPERFETSDVDFRGHHFEFLPFGVGRRMCPGIDFSLAVIEETLASLLLHFDWKLPDGVKPEDVDMTETFGISAAKKEPLCLVPTLRVPLPNV